MRLRHRILRQISGVHWRRVQTCPRHGSRVPCRHGVDGVVPQHQPPCPRHGFWVPCRHGADGAVPQHQPPCPRHGSRVPCRHGVDGAVPQHHTPCVCRQLFYVSAPGRSSSGREHVPMWHHSTESQGLYKHTWGEVPATRGISKVDQWEWCDAREVT